MSKVSVYKQIMREYERNRDVTKHKIEYKRQELYKNLPEFYKIEQELTALGISTIKSALAGKSAAMLAGELRTRGSALQERKRNLLKTHNYPETYLNPEHKCSICSDTGYVENKKCRCLRQRLISAYYEQSNLSKLLEYENFDHFDFRYYSEEEDNNYGLSPLANIETIYKKCMDFVNNFGRNYSNLLFHGDTGLGKTFLCNCIAKDLLDAGKTVLYVTAPRIFKKIEDFRFNKDSQDNPDKQLELIYDVDLLIIDDLGSEFSTVITNTELFNILNSRILEHRPVIISTNLSITELKNAYTNRIGSRIYGNFEILRLFGDDIRLKKKILRR